MSMDSNKSLFSNLNPQTALLLGLVGGFLTLGTIGFIVLGVWVLNGGVSQGSGRVAMAEPSQQDIARALPPPPVVPKSDRPKVELFVMSYCPFGLQMQKGYVEAWNLLQKKADIDVKFVSYAMHEKKEVDENTVQYCIEKEQGAKYLSYVQCFAGSGDSATCRRSAGVNEGSLSACINKANADFGILDQYNDKTKWLSGRYPVYPIHKDLNDKYQVQGSPTLVINGVQADVSRSPEAIKQAICAAFNNPPKECGQTLSTLAYVAGFGMQVDNQAGGAAAGAGCGS